MFNHHHQKTNTHSFIYFSVMWEHYSPSNLKCHQTRPLIGLQPLIQSVDTHRVLKVDLSRWNNENAFQWSRRIWNSVETQICVFCRLRKNVPRVCEASFSIPDASTGQALFENKETGLTVKSGSWDVERRRMKRQETTYGRFCASPTNLHKTRARLQAWKTRPAPVPSLSLHWFLPMQCTTGADSEQHWIIQAAAQRTQLRWL